MSDPTPPRSCPASPNEHFLALLQTLGMVLPALTTCETAYQQLVEVAEGIRLAGQFDAYTPGANARLLAQGIPEVRARASTAPPAPSDASLANALKRFDAYLESLDDEAQARFRN